MGQPRLTVVDFPKIPCFQEYFPGHFLKGKPSTYRQFLPNFHRTVQISIERCLLRVAQRTAGMGALPSHVAKMWIPGLHSYGYLIEK